MKRIYSLFLFLLISVQVSVAQIVTISDIKNKLDKMFAGLDKTRVPTGYLLDAAFNIVDFSKYSGREITDSNYVNPSVLSDIISDLNSAAVNTSQLNNADIISDIICNIESSAVPIDIVAMRYAYIVENALSDSLINYSNGRVCDSFVEGLWQNPYGESTIVGFASCETVSSYSGEASFFISDFCSNFQNTTLLEIDFGDGLGYRTVSFNQNVSVLYPSFGIKELKLRLSNSGNTYLAHCIIYFRQLVNQSVPVPASSPLDTEIFATYEGVQYKAKITTNIIGDFDEPIIVAEGFDPWIFHEESNLSKVYRLF